MSKLERCERITIRLSGNLLNQIELMAQQSGANLSEQCRRLLEKGVDVDGYKKETDFIRNIIRQELESIIEPSTNRIVKMLMKVGKISAGGFFLLIRELFGKAVTSQNVGMFNDYMHRYMLMDVDFMQLKDFKVNDYLLDKNGELLEQAKNARVKSADI
jgi:metal-responsive CopG/Arc/MetJ family transcriptional regulator